MSSKNLPAFMFYPSDWMSDLKVRSLTFEQQGIWWNLICIMHECDERGKLVMNNLPIPRRTLAQLISCDYKKLNSTMDILIKQNVAYVDERSVVYNKRMVEDQRIIEIRRAAGKLGGNPNLLNQSNKQTDKQKPTLSVTHSNTITNSDSFFKEDRIQELKEKCIENEKWLGKTEEATGMATEKIKTLCNNWIKQAQLRFEFNNYPLNVLIKYMLDALEKEKGKPNIELKPEKIKTEHDFWSSIEYEKYLNTIAK